MITPVNGWVEDMSDHVYHDGAGVSSSNLKEILRSPMHYKQKVYKETDAFLMGKAIHASVLTPKVYDAHAAVMPTFNRRTKDGKAQALLWEEERTPDDIIIKSAKDAVTIKAVQESVLGSFGHLFSNGRPEISGYFHSQEFDSLLKIRPDYLNEHEGCVVDLKTCQSADIRNAIASVRRYKYMLSAAYYLDIAQALGADVIDFVWVFAEKDPPYACAAYKASEMTLLTGREMYREALERYQQCTEADEWPAYSTEIKELDLVY